MTALFKNDPKDIYTDFKMRTFLKSADSVGAQPFNWESYLLPKVYVLKDTRILTFSAISSTLLYCHIGLYLHCVLAAFAQTVHQHGCSLTVIRQSGCKKVTWCFVMAPKPQGKISEDSGTVGIAEVFGMWERECAKASFQTNGGFWCRGARIVLDAEVGSRAYLPRRRWPCCC